MTDDTPHRYIGLIVPHGPASERVLTIFEHIMRSCERDPVPDGSRPAHGVIDPKDEFTVCTLRDAAPHRVEDVRSLDLPPGASRSEWTYPEANHQPSLQPPSRTTKSQEPYMDTDTINRIMARLEGVVLKPRLDELRDQQAHVDAVRRRLGQRLRYHGEHGTRSSMSVSHADLHVLLDGLDALDRSEA